MPMWPLPFDHYIFFATIAIIVGAMRYTTYAWAIYKKEARPHVFSWFNWGLLTGIGAYAQYALGGGPSTFALAFVAFFCFIIAFLALFVGEKNITKSDWVAFITALGIIPLWLASDSPLLAIFLILFIDTTTYWPTVRKSWNDPWGEPPKSSFWGGLRYFFMLFAIPNPTLATLLYPFFLMATDWAFGLYIVIRRHQLTKS